MSDNKDMVILTIKADVYETSPSETPTPTTWSLKSASARVSICFDSTRNLSRIISLVGQTPIINSCIMPSSQFIESSALFGTWFDERSNMTFGVGFSKQSELKEFATAFAEAKRKMIELEETGSVNTTSEISCVSVDGSQLAPAESNSSSPSSQVQDNQSNENCNNSSQNVFSFPECPNILTGTSRNANMNCSYSKSVNNNKVPSSSCNSQQCVLPMIGKENEPNFVVMNVKAELNQTELVALTQENAYLRKAVNDASKSVNAWQLEIESQRVQSESLRKAKDDALKEMGDWKNKSFAFQAEAKIWKERCEKSEAMAQDLSEETIAKYKHKLSEALNGKEYYKTVVQEKDLEIRKMKSQLALKESTPSHTAISYKRENEALKLSQAKAKQLETLSTQLANEQWTTMRDVESRMAEGIQKFIELHSDLKKSVKKGANWKTH